MKSLTISMRLSFKILKIFGRKLGDLNQYKPRPLKLPTQFPTTLTNAPKISIVTPSFGQGNYIEKTIKSILDQNYANLEYFVQDGGSKDNTVEILKQYEHLLTGWTSAPDKGQSHAINLGFSHITGEIMCWLNSDDLLLPGTLTYVANYFNTHPEVDIIYGNRLIINQDDMEIGRWILPGHDERVLSWVDYIPQETLFWRRRIWEKVGAKIDESFSFAMDWDLLLRFREAGATFAHLPYFIGAFRVHEQQKTSAVMATTGLLEINRLRERILGRLPTRQATCKAVLPFMIRHMAAEFAFRIKNLFHQNEYHALFPANKSPEQLSE